MNTNPYNTSFEQWKSARAKLAQATKEFISASTSFCAEISSWPQSPCFGEMLNVGESDLASIRSDGTSLENYMAAVLQARNSLPNLVAFNRLPREIKSFILELACTRYGQNAHTRLNEPDRACASPLVLASVCSAWRLLAINTHYIWSNIDVVIGGRSGYEAPRLWAQRSRGAPLFLTISEHRKPTFTSTDLTTDRVEELDRFLRPFMSQTRSLKLNLGRYADKLNSMVINLWGSQNAPIARDELHVMGAWGRGRPFTTLQLLAQGSNPNNSLRNVTSLTLRGCRFPTGATTMPARLIKLHLEDFNKDCGFNSQHLAELSQCSELHSLAYINCHMRNTQSNIRVTLKKLRVLRLESKEISHELHHVLQILDIGSDSLRMSLSLSDNKQFIAASRSFFGRTKVKRLYAQNVEDHASLRSLLCPIPSLEQLAIDRSYICGEPFDRFRTKNIQNGDQAWWPGLQKLYLNSCWVDANSLQYTTRLHTSLKGVYMSKPKNDDGSKWTGAQIKTTTKALEEGYGTTVHHHVKPLGHWSIVTMK